MIPSKEMLEAYFKENHPTADAQARAMYWAGIAAYAHLSSPASEEWREKNGFKED